jgi:hypothetical protein
MPFGIQLLEALAPYIVPVLIAVLSVVVKAAFDQLPANLHGQVLRVAHTAVQAVEQVASETLSGPGKKQLAIEMVMRQLAAMHINVPEPVISDVIESAVYALNQQQAQIGTALSSPLVPAVAIKPQASATHATGPQEVQQ